MDDNEIDQPEPEDEVFDYDDGDVVKPLPWWKQPSYVAAVALLIAAFSVAVIAVGVIQLRVVADGNARRSRENSEVLQSIKDNQKGINELVDFVHDLKQQATQDGNNQAVKDLETLLCASDDPVRIAACEKLGLRPETG